MVVRFANRERVPAAFLGGRSWGQIDADKFLYRLESQLMFSIEMRVRYNECDPMGFVHHCNYLTYMEIGRTEMLRASGGRYREMEAVAKIVHRYTIRRDETTIVEADITLAVIDRDGRLQRVPAELGKISDMRETN